MKTSHHFMFCFDIEEKRCDLFKLCCAQKKNNTATFNKTVLDRQKRTKHSFFHEQKEKKLFWITKKPNVDITTQHLCESLYSFNPLVPRRHICAAYIQKFPENFWGLFVRVLA
jgi:hypothetical protein